MKELDKYRGRMVETHSSYNSGSWDNWAMPDRNYYATVIELDGSFKAVYIGNSDEGSLPEPDASPELMTIYKTHLRKQEEVRLAELAEKEKHTPRVGKRMVVKAGKNKGFVGEVVFVGETRYGMAARLVAEDGDSIFTKPTNLLLKPTR